jgi:hypothetical protein
MSSLLGLDLLASQRPSTWLKLDFLVWYSKQLSQGGAHLDETMVK